MTDQVVEGHEEGGEVDVLLGCRNHDVPGLEVEGRGEVDGLFPLLGDGSWAQSHVHLLKAKPKGTMMMRLLDEE